MFMLPKDFCVKGIRTHVKKKKGFQMLANLSAKFKFSASNKRSDLCGCLIDFKS